MPNVAAKKTTSPILIPSLCMRLRSCATISKALCRSPLCFVSCAPAKTSQKKKFGQKFVARIICNLVWSNPDRMRKRSVARVACANVPVSIQNWISVALAWSLGRHHLLGVWPQNTFNCAYHEVSFFQVPTFITTKHQWQRGLQLATVFFVYFVLGLVEFIARPKSFKLFMDVVPFAPCWQRNMVSEQNL